MSQHRSVWLATAGERSFPPLMGDLAVDVAVVGGGIAGLTAALLLQRDGAEVAVIEARKVGGGTTGHTTGKVTSQHTLTYASLRERLGDAKARRYADANQQAIEIVASLCAEIGDDCDLTRGPAYVYTEEPQQRTKLEAEQAAASALGLPSVLTTETDLPFPVELALRFDGQAHFHPTRYTNGLAEAIVRGGGQVFEHTRALSVDEQDGAAVVKTESHDVRASSVVAATLLPFVDIGGFFAKARPSRAYGIAATLGSEPPAGMHISIDSPSHSTRPWRSGDRRGLIVVGQNHPTGEEEMTPGRWGELERWARQHFDVESFEYRWSAQDYITADEVPYVGRSPRTDHTFVLTGFKKWGLTNATAGARVVADLIAGRDNPWLEVFDATRIGDAQTVKKLVEDNLHVGKRFVADRAARLLAESVAHLAPGEGGMVEVDGHAVGAFRDAKGEVHAVSLTCTHLGCTVQWNGAERSWDCPCHGSRFSSEGEVLEGPAVHPLDRVDVED